MVDSRRIGVAAVVWVGFVLGTTRWMRWGTPIVRRYATDELQYEAIARAAPGLPSRAANVSAAASQRLFAHWLVGLASNETGLGLHTTYRLVTFASLAAIVVLVVRIVRALALPFAAAVVVVGLVVGNPYSWRLALIAPAMLADVVVVLGSAIALLGLVERKPLLAVLGGALAVAGREGGLGVAAGVGIWLLVRERDRRGWLAFAAGIAVFAVAKALGERFGMPDPSASGFTVLGPISHLPGTAQLLASHVARVALASPVALALLAAVPARLVRPNAAALLAALLVVQPVLLNPDWVLGNESRIAALGIVPLAVAAGSAVAAAPRALAGPAAAIVIAATAVASLHHRYTWAGLLAGPRAYVAYAAVAAVAAFAAVRLQRDPLPAGGGDTVITS